MTLNELLTYYQSKVESEQDKHALYWLLLELLEYSNSDYLLNSNSIVNDIIKKRYEELANIFISDNIPVQHLVGHSYFYGRKFIVNEHTLIPRPETEELVYKTINYIKSKFKDYKNLKVLDLATGSGCIGITLKLELGIDVTISDISSKALEVAKNNALLHNVDINIVNSDLFENIKDKYDVIITNPPYIPSIQEVDLVVTKEPNSALYSGLDGMDHISLIINQMSDYLNPNYIVSIEHGYDQSKLVANLITNNLNSVKMIQEKDLSNKDRFTFILK